MRYYCPKCLTVCTHKTPANIFVELHCFNCGHNWTDRKEDNKPVSVVRSDLQNVGVNND